MNDIKTIYNKINNSNSSVANYVFALNSEDLVQVEDSPNEMECEISESEFEDAVNCYTSGGGNVYIQTNGFICGVSVIDVNSKNLLFVLPSLTGNPTIYLYVANTADSGSGNSGSGDSGSGNSGEGEK